MKGFLIGVIASFTAHPFVNKLFASQPSLPSKAATPQASPMPAETGAAQSARQASPQPGIPGGTLALGHGILYWASWAVIAADVVLVTLAGAYLRPYFSRPAMVPVVSVHMRDEDDDDDQGAPAPPDAGTGSAADARMGELQAARAELAAEAAARRRAAVTHKDQLEKTWERISDLNWQIQRLKAEVGQRDNLIQELCEVVEQRPDGSAQAAGLRRRVESRLLEGTGRGRGGREEEFAPMVGATPATLEAQQLSSSSFAEPEASSPAQASALRWWPGPSAAEPEGTGAGASSSDDGAMLRSRRFFGVGSAGGGVKGP